MTELLLCYVAIIQSLAPAGRYWSTEVQARKRSRVARLVTARPPAAAPSKALSSSSMILYLAAVSSNTCQTHAVATCTNKLGFESKRRDTANVSQTARTSENRNHSGVYAKSQSSPLSGCGGMADAGGGRYELPIDCAAAATTSHCATASGWSCHASLHLADVPTASP